MVLDIDGVILRGNKVIPGAKEALEKLVKAKIPFIFVSNGGGLLEEVKADQLSAKLHQHIRKEQVLLCHTPYSQLVHQYGKEAVLVVGKESCLEVAQSYGFHHLYRPIDFFHHDPHVCPTKTPPSVISGKRLEKLPDIAVAMIFHDPVDWALDMQVLSDVLVQQTADHSPPQQRIPLFNCNPDIVYNNEYPHPRFTQGAFLEAFRHLFQLYHHLPLEVTQFGKPYPIQYNYAEKMLHAEANRMHYEVSTETRFFGIGDNPLSDIKGANLAGEHWSSILVRTGIFQSSHANDLHNPADHVCQDVNHAVDLLLSLP